MSLLLSFSSSLSSLYSRPSLIASCIQLTDTWNSGICQLHVLTRARHLPNIRKKKTEKRNESKSEGNKQNSIRSSQYEIKHESIKRSYLLRLKCSISTKITWNHQIELRSIVILLLSLVLFSHNSPPFTHSLSLSTFSCTFVLFIWHRVFHNLYVHFAIFHVHFESNENSTVSIKFHGRLSSDFFFTFVLSLYASQPAMASTPPHCHTICTHTHSHALESIVYLHHTSKMCMCFVS